MAVRTVTVAITGTSAQLQKALRDAGIAADTSATEMSGSFSAANDKMAASSGKLSGVLSSVFGPGNPLSKGLESISKKFKDADGEATTFGSKLAGIGEAAAVGFAVAGGAAAGYAVKFAEEFNTSMVSIDASAKAAGENIKAVTANIQASIKPAQNLGFSMSDVADSYKIIVPAVKNVADQQKLMNVAMEYARAKGIPLSQATQIVTNAYLGHTKALVQAGINTRHLTADQKDGMGAVDLLGSKVKGQAAAFGGTLSGQLDVAKAAFHNLFTEIGEKLIPIVTKMATILASFMTWLESHKEVLIAVAAVIGTVLVAAIGVWILGLIGSAAASVTAGAAAVAAGAAMVAAMLPVVAPILAIIAVVAAVGAGIYELYTHWQTVWSAITGVVSDVVTFIKSHWQMLLAILLAPFAPVILAVTTFRGTIVGTVKGLVDDVKSAWDGFETAVEIAV